VEPKRWLRAWEEGRTGFHQGTVHADLVAHADWFVAGARRILVPLCGMSMDLPYLAAGGAEVVGIELSKLAIERLFEREGWPLVPEQRGPFVSYAAGRIALLQGDIFDLDAADGLYDRVWDRAALVALPPEMRARYVPQLRSVAAPGARVLQNAFTYDASKMDGPPFSVPGDEVRSLYSGADVVRVRHEDTIVQTALRERGLDAWWTSTYRITL
jgi:thiopurine S-methyltransferase